MSPPGEIAADPPDIALSPIDPAASPAAAAPRSRSFAATMEQAIAEKPSDPSATSTSQCQARPRHSREATSRVSRGSSAAPPQAMGAENIPGTSEEDVSAIEAETVEQPEDGAESQGGEQKETTRPSWDLFGTPAAALTPPTLIVRPPDAVATAGETTAPDLVSGDSTETIASEQEVSAASQPVTRPGSPPADLRTDRAPARSGIERVTPDTGKHLPAPSTTRPRRNERPERVTEKRGETSAMSISRAAFAAARLFVANKGEAATLTPPPAIPIASPNPASRGIDGAKTSYRMEKPEETGRPQLAAEQTLPNTAIKRPVSAGNPATPSSQLVDGKNDFTPAIAAALGSASLAAKGADGAVAAASESAPAASPPTMIEQLHTKITQASVELRRIQESSMSVVLKPDAETEVSLQLQLRAGVVEVTAQFQRGDFALLSAHWTQLQQSLSHQGIRLSALEEAPSFSQHHSNSHHSQDQQAREQPMPELRPVKPITPVAAQRRQSEPAVVGSAAGRSWEGWA